MGPTRGIPWPLIALPALLVFAFEFWRHALFDGVPEPWGTFAAALIAAGGSYLYYRYSVLLIERLVVSLHEEKAGQAVMEERDRIAGQLHDSLAQTLFFLNAELERANAHLERGDLESAARSISEAREGIAFAHQDLRETIAALRRSEWDKPLLPSLRNLATNFYRQSGIEVDVSLPQSLPDLAPPVRRAIYRVAQEALTNVRKHAHASRARLALESEQGEVRLVISDDGSGFRPGSEPGFGIPEMERLAAGVGGRLEITSSGGGTEVSLTLPAGARSPADSTGKGPAH